MLDDTLNLQTLRRIVLEVNMATHLPESMQTMVNLVQGAMSAEACSVYLIDARQSRFVLVAACGFKPEAVLTVSLGLHEGLVGLVGQRGEPINLDDAASHPNYRFFPETGEERYRAFMGVPIIHQRKLLGVLVVQKRDPICFDEAEEAFLVTVSAQLAGVIAHAEARGELNAAFELQSPGREQPPGERLITGIPSSSGVGIGQALILYPKAALEAVPDRDSTDPDMDIERFTSALKRAHDGIAKLSEEISPHLAPQEQALFEAYVQLLEDESFAKEVVDEIRSGQWAPGALRRVIERHVKHFENVEDPYLRERAADLEDLGSRILSEMEDQSVANHPYFPQTVLVGEELTASRLAEIPRQMLAGIISIKSSAHSHVAIIARAMGVPAVTGADGMPLKDIEGKECVVDGYYGRIYIEPNAVIRREFHRLQDEERELAQGLEELKALPAETPDGHRLPLLVNSGLVSDFHLSQEVGAEGVGLYRSEVPFLLRDRFPSEEEQRILYRDLLFSFKDQMVTMRTLDVGADKSLPYFPVHEQNPALGWRGIRITLDHPEIFLVQIRAMLWASDALNNMQIMLPMISSVQEVDESLRLIHQAHREVVEEGAKVVMPRIGVMIEVPSAVYQAEALASRVDFLSVGSNDLTQYLLAVDRNNTRVASLYDPLHPAVLEALTLTVEAGHRKGKTVGICGEMAGDPIATILLLAMGFDSLSMNATSIPRVKWVIRNFTKTRAQALWAECKNLKDAGQIRQHLIHALEAVGLGGLIRAGK